MNEEHTNQILESLLSEMLTGQHPPDLTQPILSAWRREQAKPQAAAAALSDAAMVIATPIRPGHIRPNGELTGRAGQQVPKQRASDSQPAKAAANSTPTQRLYRAMWLMAACAAGIGFLIWSFGKPANQPDKSLAEQTSNQSTSAVDAAADIAASKKQAVEKLELDDLPFEGPQPSVAELAANPQRRPQDNSRLDSRDVIAGLDRRLEQLWQGLAIAPNPDYDDAALADRMSLAMTGEKLPGPLPVEDFDRFALTAQAVQSRAFAKHWAAKFTNEWLERSGLTADSQSRTDLQQSIATRIEKDQNWNQVVLDLLGGDLNNPASASNVFIGALVDEDNGAHRLAERIGSNFLDANLACVRCHDQGVLPQRAIDKQETYWSLLAMLKGLDAKTEEQSNQRIVTDRQAELFADAKSPIVYYDLPNGALKSATAKLPDGSEWNASVASGDRVPRQVLAEWISRSPELDRATVNQVWKMVFGRLLVPHVPQTESAGIPERKDMLEFLAAQFRAHNHDLKRLVGWVVNSQAFAKQPLQLTKSQWLDASDEELEGFQLRELVFAAGPTLGRGDEAKSLDASLMAAVQWNRPAELHTDGTLAQRAADAAPDGDKKPQSETPSAVTMPAMSFVLHGQRHTVSQRDVRRQLASRGSDSAGTNALSISSDWAGTTQPAHEFSNMPKNCWNKILVIWSPRSCT